MQEPPTRSYIIVYCRAFNSNLEVIFIAYGFNAYGPPFSSLIIIDVNKVIRKGRVIYHDLIALNV